DRRRVGLSPLADFERIDPDGLGDVLEPDGSEIADRYLERAFTSRKASSERQIAPGFATPSNRAAILTPSPFKSPSLSSTTPPKCMPTRNSMRHSGGTPAFRSTRPVCSSVAQPAILKVWLS